MQLGYTSVEADVLQASGEAVGSVVYFYICVADTDALLLVRILYILSFFFIFASIFPTKFAPWKQTQSN